MNPIDSNGQFGKVERNFIGLFEGKQRMEKLECIWHRVVANMVAK